MPKPDLRLHSDSDETHSRSTRPNERSKSSHTAPPLPNRQAAARRRERDFDQLAGVSEPRTVPVALSAIVPLLVDAVENDRAWLKDFADEPVRIDADLYEVLLAYQQLRQRPAA